MLPDRPATRRVTVVSLLGFALALAAVGALLCWTPHGPIRTLPDGSTIEFVGMTYGRNHRVVYGNLWQKLLLPVVPGEWDRYIGGTSREEHTDSDRLLLWTVRRRGAVWPVEAWTAVDAHGDEAADGEMAGSVMGSRSRDPFPMDHLVSVFPRSQRRFRVRIYDSSPLVARSVPPAEFTVVNPVPTPAADWRPRRLPLTANARGIRVTLLSLVTGAGATPLERAAPGESAWTYLTVAIKPREEAGHWAPERVAFYDASGNRWATDRSSESANHWDSPGCDLWGWQCALWPSQPAYLVRLVLKRTRGSRVGGPPSRTVEFLCAASRAPGLPPAKVSPLAR